MAEDKKNLVNILPLYEIDKYLILLNDDLLFYPPGYDDLENLPTSSSSGNSRRVGPDLDTRPPHHHQSPASVVVDEGTSHWEHTILANVNSMHNLSKSDNQFSKSIKTEIFFTEEPGEVGVAPKKFIDTLKYEYKQGDRINGYLLMENTSEEIIPFDMFYVLFEGMFKVRISPNKVVVKKLLDMIDVSASWHYGNFNGKVIPVNWFYTGPNIFKDPLDGTQLSLGHLRKLLPNVLHKRFFNFTIPNQLLESTCIHSLAKHTELPPTVGKWESLSTTPDSMRDFSFPDTSIRYTISWRFVGKASYYGVKPEKSRNDKAKITNSDGDEFLILRGDQIPVRIVEEIKRDDEIEMSAYLGNRLYYENFLSRIDEVLEEDGGLEPMLSAGSFSSNLTPSLSPMISNPNGADEYVKFQQLYRPSRGKKIEIPSSTFYKVVQAIEKRTLGSSKYVGSLILSTPKHPHVIRYIPPKQFRGDDIDNSSWKFAVPIELEFVLPTSKDISPSKLPDIKSIDVELIAFSLKSHNGPIPIEFTYDMIFSNKNVQNEVYLEDTILKKLKPKLKKLKDLARKVGPNFRMEVQLAQDLETMCTLKTKVMKLSVDPPEIWSLGGGKKFQNVNEIPWTYEGEGFKSNKKRFELKIDLTTSKFKGESGHLNTSSYDSFCLIPHFQLCHMARFYFLKVTMHLKKGEVISINLPVEIDK